jgi:hypothetical protein
MLELTSEILVVLLAGVALPSVVPVRIPISSTNTARFPRGVGFSRECQLPRILRGVELSPITRHTRAQVRML